MAGQGRPSVKGSSGSKGGGNAGGSFGGPTSELFPVGIS